MAAYARELTHRQGEIPPGTEPRHANPRLVYGKRGVASRREIQTTYIVDRARERIPGSLGVVQRYYEDVVRVCKGAVPPVVVVGVPNAEAAAVDGEEGRERLRRGLVVGRGEEDPSRVSFCDLVWPYGQGRGAREA